MRRIVRFAGLLCVAAAVMAAPRATAVGCNDDSSEDGIPDEVAGSGEVTAVNGRSFTVGEATFVRPTSRAQLKWCGADPASGDEGVDDEGVEWSMPRVHVGDHVNVGGSLRADGTVLAYWIYNEDVVDDGHGASMASGVVTSTDGTPSDDAGISFVMNGNTYRFDFAGADYETTHGEMYATDPVDGGEVAIDWVLPGDTVFVTYRLGDDGGRVADFAYVLMSGAGTVVSGTITNVWDDGGEFAVDGVPAVCDDATTLVFRDPADRADEPDDPDSAGENFGGLRAGQIVQLTGVLRNGVVFADELVIVREPESRGAKRLAKRLGRLRAHGMLEDVRADGAVVVSGLAIRTRGRVGRAVLKSAPAATARRVKVAATIRGGVILASSIQRR